ncbi:MAG: hypothetical protein LOX97_04365 [Sphingomonas sp.]|nr:hypothetical protein [Sphingomonas sp.]
MRASWLLLPLMLVPAPALAAPGRQNLPAELSDPAVADQLGRMMGALTRSLLDMPVGELEAAVEGREPSAEDRKRKLGDHVGGPEAAREVEARVSASGRQMQAMTRALVDSLPTIMESLENIEREIERRAANLPDPGYPRR